MKRIFELLKKLAKKKSFWVILVIILILGIYTIIKAGGSKVEYTQEKVKRGNLVQIVSETGAIESASAIDLNFKGSGILAEVFFKEGDAVKEGDLLARLEAENLEIAVRQAQANLNMAKANYDKLLAGASFEDLKVTEETVNNARIAYENAKRNYDALVIKIDYDLKNFEEAKNIAQKNFDDSLSMTDQSVKDSRVALLNAIDSKISQARSAMDAIKMIFDNNYLTLQYSVKNPQYGIDSHNYYDESKVRLALAETAISKLKAEDTEGNLSDAKEKLSDLLVWVKKSLDSTYMGLVNTLVGNLYNEAANESDKLSINNQQTIIDAAISALDAAKQNYTNAMLNYESNYNKAKGSLDTATINLNSALANKDSQLAQAKSSLDSALGAYNLAKAQYDYKKAKPRGVDVAYYQAQVDQSRAAYDLAVKNLDDYRIYAPVDGTVTFVNYKVGEQVVPGNTLNPAVSMLGSTDFEIKIDVPESDIVKIKVGNPVNVTLDAYGSDVVFTGEITYIDVAETVIQDVVYYQITVALDKSDIAIKSGMTANADIVTATADNVLYLPNRAIKQDETGKKYVEILKFGNNVEKVYVETGIKADLGTEIKTGLNEGQEVIVFKKQK